MVNNSTRLITTVGSKKLLRALTHTIKKPDSCCKYYMKTFCLSFKFLYKTYGVRDNQVAVVGLIDARRRYENGGLAGRAFRSMHSSAVMDESFIIRSNLVAVVGLVGDARRRHANGGFAGIFVRRALLSVTHSSAVIDESSILSSSVSSKI